ncbi:YadA C-terminal domain-containing protein [Thermodesulfobacteriota bacterium]
MRAYDSYGEEAKVYANTNVQAGIVAGGSEVFADGEGVGMVTNTDGYYGEQAYVYLNSDSGDVTIQAGYDGEGYYDDGEVNIYSGDGEGMISVTDDGVDLTLSDSYYDGEGWVDTEHGVIVRKGYTEVSGGYNSTFMTLDDDGVSLEDENGSPVQIHGVAPGSIGTDAVNKNQLDDVSTDAYSGIAGVAAMAAIPAPIDGHKYAFGMGAGNYKGESALAAGFNANLGTNFRLTGAVGWMNGGSLTSNVGIGYSW